MYKNNDVCVEHVTLQCLTTCLIGIVFKEYKDSHQKIRQCTVFSSFLTHVMTNVEEKLLVLPNPQNQKSTSKNSRDRHCICDSAPLLLLGRPKHQKFLMSSAKLANNHGQDCNDLCQVPTSTPQQQAPRQPLLPISMHQHW